jgi:uncharacterized protein
MQAKSWKTRYLFYVLLATQLPWFAIGFLQGVLENRDPSWKAMFDRTSYLFLEDCFELLLVCCSVFWVVVKKYSASLEEIGLSTKSLCQNIIIGGVAGVLLWGLSNSIVEASEYLTGRTFIHPIVRRILDTKTKFEFILLFIMGTVFAALSEEIFLRGFVYNTFKKGFTRTSAIILTSGLFALFHVDLILWPVAFVSSVYLIFCYEYTGTLVASMMAHCVANSLAFLLEC